MYFKIKALEYQNLRKRRQSIRFREEICEFLISIGAEIVMDYKKRHVHLNYKGLDVYVPYYHRYLYLVYFGENKRRFKSKYIFPERAIAAFKKYFGMVYINEEDTTTDEQPT